MRIVSCSHMHAGTILEHDFPEEFEDISSVLASLEVPLRAAGPFTDTGRPKTPKRQAMSLGGVRRFGLMPVDQDALNKALAERFRARGWSSEPIATIGFTVPEELGELKLAGDFVKNRVFMEVEFGNVASMYRDIFKFQIANRSRAGDIGVLLTGTKRLMKFSDQGQATFEAAEKLLPYLSLGIQMPLWIIGIEPEDWSSLEERYGEMLQVATENGVDCHTFSSMMGADPEPSKVDLLAGNDDTP